MSLSINNIKTLAVKDPRVDPTLEKIYICLKGSANTTFINFSTTNISSSSITFSVRTPSPYVFMNKYLYFKCPVRLLLTTSTPNANNLLRAGYDAPRAFPISQSLNTLAVSYNGSTASINLSDVFSGLIRYNTDEEIKHHEYSHTPSYLDTCQNYSDEVATVRNALGFSSFAQGDWTSGRAGFPFTIVENTPTHAVIDFVCAEPLFLSPQAMGSMKNMGGTGFLLNNMDVNFTFLGNAMRMWSHAEGGPNEGGKISEARMVFNNFTSLNNNPFSYSDNTPQLMFEYLTPQEVEHIPRILNYPYFKVDRYISDYRQTVAGGADFEITSNNIILNSMPHAIYIYARNNNDVLQNGFFDNNGNLTRSACSISDTFAGLKSLSINFANKAGILSSASAHDLYTISQRNGVNMNWSQWSGLPVYQENSFSQQYGLIGSIIKLIPQLDIGTNATECAGVSGSFNLIVNAKFFNPNLTQQMNPALYIVVVSEGVMTIDNAVANFNIGVLTPEDCLNAQTNVGLVDFEDIRGGNFIESLKNFGSRVYGALKKVWNKYGKKAEPYIKTLVPMTAPAFELAHKYLDEDEEQKEGSGLYVRGGKLTNKAQLKKRLKHRLLR